METDANQQTEEKLTWRVHLVRRNPERLPALLLVLFIGGACVWLLFGRPLPVLTALALLLGAASEYLLPTTFRITREGVTARSLTAYIELSWRDARRCLPDRAGLVVTSLPVKSRLDRFRGILLRFAPPGEPGDSASVLCAIARYAPTPDILPRDAAGAPADIAHIAPDDLTLPGACR